MAHNSRELKALLSGLIDKCLPVGQDGRFSESDDTMKAALARLDAELAKQKPPLSFARLLSESPEAIPTPGNGRGGLRFNFLSTYVKRIKPELFEASASSSQQVSPEDFHVHEALGWRMTGAAEKNQRIKTFYEANFAKIWPLGAAGDPSHDETISCLQALENINALMAPQRNNPETGDLGGDFPSSYQATEMLRDFKESSSVTKGSDRLNRLLQHVNGQNMKRSPSTALLGRMMVERLRGGPLSDEQNALLQRMFTLLQNNPSVTLEQAMKVMLRVHSDEPMKFRREPFTNRPVQQMLEQVLMKVGIDVKTHPEMLQHTLSELIAPPAPRASASSPVVLSPSAAESVLMPSVPVDNPRITAEKRLPGLLIRLVRALRQPGSADVLSLQREVAIERTIIALCSDGAELNRPFHKRSYPDADCGLAAMLHMREHRDASFQDAVRATIGASGFPMREEEVERQIQKSLHINMREDATMLINDLRATDAGPARELSESSSRVPSASPTPQPQGPGNLSMFNGKDGSTSGGVDAELKAFKDRFKGPGGFRMPE